ncbi:MAG: glutamyl-tRNA reductase [Bradymonadia bacterium]
MKQLIVMGLSHRTAPVQIRERFAIPAGQVPDTAAAVSAIPGTTEAFVLSTCNRVEVYAAAEDVDQARRQLPEVLASVGGASARLLDGHAYVHAGSDAVRHLFRVTASLDSMVVGEPQIQGQIKTAFDLCRQSGAAGAFLQRTMDQALRVAKRVRTETGIARNAVSVSSVAVDLARQIFGDLKRSTALMVGAGEMGELAAKALVDGGVHTLLVANRSIDRAVRLAEALGGHPRGLDELDELLVRTDIVITSTGARDYIISPKQVKRVLKARKYRPLFFIDIAVPRNVDPKINNLDSVFVYDVDDLSSIAQENLASRQREAEQAEQMVTSEVTRFVQAQSTQNAVKPVIQALRRKAADIKAEELSRAGGKLGDLTPAQQKSVERLVDGVINKLLHGVQTGLKRSQSAEGGPQTIALVQQLFNLEIDSLEGQPTPMNGHGAPTAPVKSETPVNTSSNTGRRGT